MLTGGGGEGQRSGAYAETEALLSPKRGGGGASAFSSHSASQYDSFADRDAVRSGSAPHRVASRAPAVAPSPILQPLHVPPAELRRSARKEPTVARAILFGLVEAIIVTPIMVAFAGLVFHDVFFTRAGYAPGLVKLVVFGGMVHQLVFCVCSSLPFAVGQVQDAGLIFLSGMATDVVARMHALYPHMQATDPGDGPDSPAAVMATVGFTLALSTALLGAMLIVAGRLRLAELISYLPSPVMGGYLAYLGTFILLSAIAAMGNVPYNGDVRTASVLFGKDAVLLFAPGLAASIVLLFLVNRIRHFAVVPTFIFILPLVFYACAHFAGTTLPELRDAGWLAPETVSPHQASAASDASGGGAFGRWLASVEVWSIFRPSLVHWRVVASQGFRWLAMYVVIAFSSSLDVAAIQLGMTALQRRRAEERRLARTDGDGNMSDTDCSDVDGDDDEDSAAELIDFNRELQTVGCSNLVAGCFGGLTGSYIFSQTIFLRSMGVGTRVAGLTLAAVELFFFLLPISITAYVPKLVFGSVLCFIGIDLIIEWLVFSARKVPAAEYAGVVLTYASMLMLGIELGGVVGMLPTAAMALRDFVRRFDHNVFPAAPDGAFVTPPPPKRGRR